MIVPAHQCAVGVTDTVHQCWMVRFVLPISVSGCERLTLFITVYQCQQVWFIVDQGRMDRLTSVEWWETCQYDWLSAKEEWIGWLLWRWKASVPQGWEAELVFQNWATESQAIHCPPDKKQATKQTPGESVSLYITNCWLDIGVLAHVPRIVLLKDTGGRG